MRLDILQRAFSEELEKIAAIPGTAVTPPSPLSVMTVPIRLAMIPIRMADTIIPLPGVVYKDLKSYGEHKGWIKRKKPDDLFSKFMGDF